MTGNIKLMIAGSHGDVEAARPAEVTNVVSRKVSVHDDRIDSRDLFAGVREITIAHGEETYRLRLTSQNKLILTK